MFPIQCPARLVESPVRISAVREIVKTTCHLAACLAILCSMPGTVSRAQDAVKPAAEIPGVAATEFVYPLAVTAQADGLIFVADRNLPGIWKVENGQKSVYFQGSKEFRTQRNAVRCLAIDHQGKLLAGDSSTREVYRFDDAGQAQPLTDGKPEQFVAGDLLDRPVGLCRSGENLLIADPQIRTIFALAPDKTLTVVVKFTGGSGSGRKSIIQQTQDSDRSSGS